MARIIAMIKAHHHKYKNSLKSKGRRNTVCFHVKVSQFKVTSSRLSDICSCKCKDNNCTCLKPMKVSIREKEFLEDQRGERKMFIDSVDIQTTKLMEKSVKGKRKDVAKIRTGV